MDEQGHAGEHLDERVQAVRGHRAEDARDDEQGSQNAHRRLGLLDTAVPPVYEIALVVKIGVEHLHTYHLKLRGPSS